MSNEVGGTIKSFIKLFLYPVKQEGCNAETVLQVTLN